jgi:hypothetical protein
MSYFVQITKTSLSICASLNQTAKLQLLDPWSWDRQLCWNISNCWSVLHNIPEEQSTHLHYVRSLISRMLLLVDKGVSIPSNTTMFDFIYLAFFTPATCFGLLSGHHQALGYAIQLYIYLLLLLTAIHYYCLYISVVTDTPCTVVFRVLVSTHMCVMWFLFPVWGLYPAGFCCAVCPDLVQAWLFSSSFVGRTCVCTY